MSDNEKRLASLVESIEVAEDEGEREELSREAANLSYAISQVRFAEEKIAKGKE